MNQRLTSLLDKARSFPNEPGCYLMKNQREEVIYVGKAKSLRSRVSSYFNNSVKTPKTEILVSHIRDVEFILTNSDTEAFILENNLIKKYSPKYNIRLRDDKSYPYVVVNHNEPFPRIEYQRKIKRDDNKEVFGPFPDGSNISEVLRVITKSFQLRDCTLREFKGRKDPCLLYQLKQCSAPCVALIKEEKYDFDLKMALNIFKGRGKRSLKILEDQMMEFAQNEEFEKAAILRDNIEIIKNFLSRATKNNVEVDLKYKDIDFISFFSGEIETDVTIYMVRNNLLLGHKTFHFPAWKFSLKNSESIETEDFYNILIQYYTSSHDSIPEAVVLPINEVDTLSAVFAEVFENQLKVFGPKPEYKNLLNLASQHACEHQRVRLSNQESKFLGLRKLRDLLNLKETPLKLECYDIAIWQGEAPYASQIVFIDGSPSKSDYRAYELATRPEGNNDFAMMEEVIARRLNKGHLPDVFIVDGGKGQVSAFEKILREQDVSTPVVGIAKSKIKKSNLSSTVDSSEKSEERLIIPGRLNPYILKKNIALFRIIVAMRDEAHRFSRKFHHKNMIKKRFSGGFLDNISGIGPKTKTKILKNLDIPLDELRELSVIEISKKLEISERIAKKIYNQISNLEIK